MKKPRKEPAEKVGKTLSASEEEYRELVENINDILLTLDIQGNITYISPVVERISKYKISDLIGEPFTQLIYPDDLPALLDRFTRLLSGQLEPWEFRVVDKDGRIIFVRTSSRPLYKDRGVVGITTLLTDISEHKKIEEKLRESESRYRDLVDNSKNGVAVYEPLADGEDFIFKDFNHAAEMIDKIKKEDIIGKSLIQTFPGIKDFGLFEVLQRVLRTGVPERHPINQYHDERISAWRDNYVYRLSSGEIVVIYEDVTARKQSEDLLQRERLMLARTEGIANVGSWEWDIATDTVIWSEELFRIFQRDPQEGAPSFAEHPAFYNHDDMARLRQAVEVCIADGTPYELELRAIRKDGEIRVCIARGAAEMAPDGRAVRLFGSLQDVTELKRAEVAFYQSEVRFRELFNHMKSGVCIYEAIDNGGDFIFKDFNPAAEMIEQTTKKDVLGKRVSEVFTGVKTFGIFEVFQRVWRSGDPEYFPEHIYKDDKNPGSWRDSWIFKLPNGEIVAVYNDVSERKLAEEKLTKSYESLQKTLNDAISTMVKIVEMRDPYTSGHQIKVADLAVAIAREMKLDDIRIDQLRISAVIHDVGKMYIPSDILAKPGKLANIELDLIKTHSQCGYDIVKGMDLPCSVANTVLQHHERLDGSGYPYQLKGENTLLEAKILAVADVVEAMSSHRPYRPALGIDKALEEISKNKGILYDPDVVGICLELFNSGNFEFKTVG
jgi:PAS domain S-box-containing protein/putative nucleotidyltransferase with HDIG domain